MGRYRREVAVQPPSFHREVQEHIRVQQNFTAFCGSVCNALAKVGHNNTIGIRQTLRKTITFPSTEFYDTFSLSYQDCLMHLLDEMQTKKVLIYNMYQHSCGRHQDLVDRTKVQCDVNQHVIPGLYMNDIKKLLNKALCYSFLGVAS